MPKVSIVLPTYNGSAFITEAIDSILNQTYSDFELIIVNDCSTDNTLQLCQDYAQKDKRIKLISNSTNLKLPASLNVGFSYAIGEYFTWTSDDNYYKDNAIEKMVKVLDSEKNTDLVSFNFDFIKEDGSEDKSSESLYPNRQAWHLAFLCNVGACFMYRKAIANKVGDYDTTLFCAEDYEYWCRIASQGNIRYCSESLYYYRNNSKSLTATKRNEVAEKTEIVIEKYLPSILKKYGFSKKQICKELLDRYNLLGNTAFLKRSYKESILLTILSLIQERLFNRSLCLKSLNKFPLYPLKNTYQEKLKDIKEIVIWGTGLYGKAIYNLISSSFPHIRIVGFADTYVTDNEHSLFGLRVYSPKQASLNYPNACFVLASEYYESMKAFALDNSFNITSFLDLTKEERNFERASVAYINNKDKNSLLYYLSSKSILSLANI